MGQLYLEFKENTLCVENLCSASPPQKKKGSFMINAPKACGPKCSININFPLHKNCRVPLGGPELPFYARTCCGLIPTLTLFSGNAKTSFLVEVQTSWFENLSYCHLGYSHPQYYKSPVQLRKVAARILRGGKFKLPPLFHNTLLAHGGQVPFCADLHPIIA